MDFAPSAAQDELAAAARQLLEGHASPAQVRAHVESGEPYDAGLWDAMVQQGWVGVALPEAAGGLGLGWVEAALLLEEVGRANAPAPYLPSLLAAAGLLLDYVLNVAVGISAGVGALISTVPSLHPFALPLCFGILLVIVVANLRGTGEAGWLFALPAYLFILSFIGIMSFGVFEAVAGGWHLAPAVPPPAPAPSTAASIARRPSTRPRSGSRNRWKARRWRI